VSALASFDMDDTIITTRSGKIFAETADDWKWWHDAVPPKLRELASVGYKLVFFTNQSGIGKGTTDVEAFRQKIDAVQAALDLPILFLVATGSDNFRKPRTGMWDHLGSHLNDGVSPDMSKSFFVGDAAGRPSGGGIKEDFSDSDFRFAYHLKLPFCTPDKFFLQEECSLRPCPVVPGTGEQVAALVTSLCSA